ncbi:hypothetical protein [Amycolatopsis sp. La24]|uniref:hypothetical protein n=1 Tax=Amycolatopsis sp. La24 TaxID=3028304 RepID=UPI0023AF7B8E|nr:hypothetical protein [Amycolatopsis sp. La24]
MISKRFALLTATAAAAFSLSACGSSAPSLPNNPAPATVQENAKPEQPRTNEQGYLPKKVGERAGLFNPDGSNAVDFWVTKVSVDPKCGEYGSRSAGKHTIVVDMTVQTYKMDPQVSSSLGGVLNPTVFQTRGKDGVTNEASISMCVDSPKRLPDQYAPNSKYTGQLEFESPDASGALLLTPMQGMQGSSGWEWQF